MVKKKILIIIQARIGSSRLPGKVLRKLINKPILLHIVNRLRKIKNSNIVIATSKNKKDKKIINFCKKNKINYFSGSENNVLDRFYKTAANFDGKNIIRVTGDCPLIDPVIIKKLIKFYFKYNYDHAGIATGAGVHNLKIKKFPDGLDAEIFKFSALKKAWQNSKNKIEREHVTPYIWKRSKKFKIGIFQSREDYSNYRWTLDNIKDFRFIKKIYKNLYKNNKIFYMKDVINFLNKNPKIALINEKNIGREKYEEIRE